jgi:hypothetical protein
VSAPAAGGSVSSMPRASRPMPKYIEPRHLRLIAA